MWTRISEAIIRFLWRKDRPSRGRLGGMVIEFLQLVYVAVRDVLAGQLTLRAMSLVYTTLLSFVPLIAVSFSVLKAFGVHNQIAPLLIEFLAPLGARGEEISGRILRFVENINVGVLGAVGLGTLIFTVLSVIQKVEDAFNEIWNVHRPRSFLRRFSDYLSVLLVGPVLIFSALGITASIMNTRLARRILSLEPFGTAVYLASTLLPFVFVCAAFTFLYMFIPNTRVKFRSGVTGGVFAGLLWQGSGWAFASFVAGSANYPAIYSGFAVVIIFMLWLYLSWLILLVGAEVSFYHQYPHLLTPTGEPPPQGRRKERLALQVMLLVGSRHYFSRPLRDLDGLARQLRLSVRATCDLIDLLRGKGLLLETCDEPPRYAPAKDAGAIPLREIVDAVRTADGDILFAGAGGPAAAAADDIMQEVEHALDNALQGRTLKSALLDHEAALGPAAESRRQGRGDDRRDE